VQSNRKMQVDRNGSRTCRGKEIGVDRYEEITSPELAPAFDAYWAKTGAYWKEVRETWSSILKDKDGFSMKDTYDGKQLYMIHFDHAAKLEKDGEVEPDASARHARETIRSFLLP
jgi:hypothetical protein